MCCFLYSHVASNRFIFFHDVIFYSHNPQLQKMYPYTLTQLTRANPFCTPVMVLHEAEEPGQDTPVEPHLKRTLAAASLEGTGAINILFEVYRLIRYVKISR